MAAACGAAGDRWGSGTGHRAAAHPALVTQVHHTGIHSALLKRLLCTRPCCMCQRNTAMNKRDKKSHSRGISGLRGQAINQISDSSDHR